MVRLLLGYFGGNRLREIDRENTIQPERATYMTMEELEEAMQKMRNRLGTRP